MVELKENDLLFAKVNENAIIPSKESENAGYDIYACFEDNYIIIPPHSTKLIPTGIAAAVSEDYYLQVHERGSTGSKGMKYGAGVIDSGYRNEIFICINNINNTEIFISKLSKQELLDKYATTLEDGVKVINYGSDFENAYFDDPIFPFEDPIIYPHSKAIAQLVVHKSYKMDLKEVSYEELKAIPSERGLGCLGSTGA